MDTTKEMIQATALKLFREKGYNNVTMNDICKECGIVKSTFYYHIKSKEELISHLFDNVCELIYKNVPQMLNAENTWMSIWKCFEPIISFSIEIGADLSSQCLKTNLKKDIGTYDLKKDLKDIVIPWIEKAQKEGLIRNQSPAEELYEISIYLIYGFDLVWCIKKGDFDKTKKIYRALENLYDLLPEIKEKR